MPEECRQCIPVHESLYLSLTKETPDDAEVHSPTSQFSEVCRRDERPSQRLAFRSSTAIAGGFSANQNPANDPSDTKYPKLSMIVPYSPQTLRFAASVGYEGIVIPVNGNTADLDNLTDSQIDKISDNSARRWHQDHQFGLHVWVQSYCQGCR